MGCPPAAAGPNTAARPTGPRLPSGKVDRPGWSAPQRPSGPKPRRGRLGPDFGRGRLIDLGGVPSQRPSGPTPRRGRLGPDFRRGRLIDLGGVPPAAAGPKTAARPTGPRLPSGKVDDLGGQTLNSWTIRRVSGASPHPAAFGGCPTPAGGRGLITARPLRSLRRFACRRTALPPCWCSRWPGGG